MAHTGTGFIRAVTSATTTHSVDLANVAAGETLALAFMDRTGGAVINSVADEDGGTWTIRSTQTVSTFLNCIYIRENATANALLTITVTTNASQNAQLVAMRVASDTGGGVYPTYDAVATVVRDTDLDTTLTSNAVTATAGGSLVGGMWSSNSQSSAPTMGGTAVAGSAGAAGVRLFLVFDARAASGSHSFTGTWGANPGNCDAHALSLIDSASADSAGSLIGGKLIRGGLLMHGVLGR